MLFFAFVQSFFSRPALRVLAWLLCGCLVLAPARAADLLLDEDFSQWPDRQWTMPGSWDESGWRLVGTAGSAGNLQVLDLAEGRVMRITRTNATGDLVCDKWDDDKRLLVKPGSTVFVRVWARQVGSPATLNVNLYEFNGSTPVTGLEHLQSFALTGSFAPYSFQVTLASTTTELCPGFRIHGTGVLDLQRVEITLPEPALTYLDESFTAWDPLNVLLPGTWQVRDWRLFGVSGAMGQYQLVSTAEGPVLQMTWSNSAGDAALDRDLAGLRLMAPPGVPLKFRIRARRVGGSANLRASLAEYNAAGTFLGVESVQLFTLTSDFATYEFSPIPSANAVLLNPALRVAGTGMLQVKRIELLRDGVIPPTIELPQGWTPNAAPMLYWRAPAHQALRVQLAPDAAFSNTLYDTGVLADARNQWQLPAMQAGASQFARVCVQDFSGTWSDWSAPTLIIYQPLPQAAPATMYVYDLNPTRALSAAESFEQAHLVAAIAGLANRERPRLFIRWLTSDDYWLDALRQSGRWLEPITPFHLGASQGYFKKTSTGLEINRANMIGDTGLDRYETDQHLSVPASTAVTLKVWARTISGTNRIRMGLDEFSGTNQNPVRSSTQVSTLGATFQLVSLPVTTQGSTDAVSPSLRADGIGTLQIQRIELVGTSNGQSYLIEDFTGWPTFSANLPGHWTRHDWRMFGTTNPTIEMLVSKFPDVCTGVVLYDPNVPATSNVASTIAGTDGLLPIPFRDVAGSLYQRLVAGGPKLPVIVNLVGKFTGTGTIPDIGEASSGSAKNDAYRWTLKRYLETGKCGAGVLGNYIDYFWVNHAAQGGDYANSTASNHDFFIQHKAFFYDLNVWDDEAPNDDPGQPLGTDKATLKRILAAAAAQLPEGECLHVGGFVPWAFKYVNPYGSHEGVETEWHSVTLYSNYNAYIDADALGLSGLANASLYSLMPKVDHYLQPPPPQLAECQSAGWLSATGQVAPNNYYVNYIGDYDSAAWVMSQLPSRWDSIHRGREVLSWAWGPQLMRRGMPMFDTYVRQATPRDSIWAADNGAGYLNPTQLTVPRAESGLPDGTARWQAYCAQWYRRLGIRHSGFVIDGGASRITTAQEAMYEAFSGDGTVTQYQGAADNAPRMNGTMPVVDNALGELSSDPAEAANAIAGIGAATGQHRFITARSILKPTEFYYDLDRALLRDHAVARPVRLDPSTYFYLMRHDLGGQNYRRASVLHNALNAQPQVGRTITGKVYLRNLGWDVWPAAGTQAVRIGIELTAADLRQNPQLLNLPHDVAPGQLVEIAYTLPAPANVGAQYIRVDLQQNQSWFGDHGNLADLRQVLIDPRSVAQSATTHWHLFE